MGQKLHYACKRCLTNPQIFHYWVWASCLGKLWTSQRPQKSNRTNQTLNPLLCLTWSRRRERTGSAHSKLAGSDRPTPRCYCSWERRKKYPCHQWTTELTVGHQWVCEGRCWSHLPSQSKQWWRKAHGPRVTLSYSLHCSVMDMLSRNSSS